MTNKEEYTQCTMERTTENGGILRIVSFIPSQYAVLGKVLKLKDHAGEFLDGFKVVTVHSASTESPPDYRKAIRRHRDATGDSLPK